MLPTPDITANERDPLLLVKGDATPSKSTSQLIEPNETIVQAETPLPIRQLLILAVVRLAEPINFTVIFPFVNQVGFCRYDTNSLF